MRKTLVHCDSRDLFDDIQHRKLNSTEGRAGLQEDEGDDARDIRDSDREAAQIQSNFQDVSDIHAQVDGGTEQEEAKEQMQVRREVLHTGQCIRLERWCWMYGAEFDGGHAPLLRV